MSLMQIEFSASSKKEIYNTVGGLQQSVIEEVTVAFMVGTY
jgi:hypothetical protein